MQYKVCSVPESWRKVELTPNARTVLTKRYLRRNEEGKPIETVEEMFYRVSYNIALGESTPDDIEKYTKIFYDMLTAKDFFPNTPTFTGAGTPLGQLAACFVLPIADDLGRDPAGIMSTLRNAALIQQTGGGNGFSFSRLRQKGAFVATSAGTSTGPVGFLKVFDSAFGMIAQGGSRRGANMAVLRVDHPDIREFISCKASEANITNFNISVGITDKFMQAVRDDTDFDLIAPHTKKVVETVRAREIFDRIVQYAHHNGEPGVLFLDTANRANPVPHLYELESTNPCGEQWLGPYENCCLGSVNLYNHVLNRQVDWEKLAYTVSTGTRFLDNVVTVNAYVDAVPQLKEAALRCRRIGLGIMGLADLMVACGVRYGSPEGEEFVSQVMEFIRYHAMKTSAELAAERGAFPGIVGSIYDANCFSWKIPTPLPGIVHTDRFGRPALDWSAVRSRIMEVGIRNAAQTTVAPTGTIATVAGCEGYGCEPVFALAYIRHVNDNGRDLVLNYTSPPFEEALREAGYSLAEQQAIIDQVMENGTCQNIPNLRADIKNRFVVSGDITPSGHVRMQAAMQAFVDNSMSKTCNLPAGATEADVAECYMQSWSLGCKGITVYVTGSRQQIVLETKKDIAEKAKKAAEEAAKLAAQTPAPSTPGQESKPLPTPVNIAVPEIKSKKSPLPISLCEKKSRPKSLTGCTHIVNTPVGKAYVTVNEDPDKQPFEVFINTAKAGSETAAVSEAFGRLISYILRVNSPVEPSRRLQHVVKQLIGIGGRRAAGFGPNRVLSLSDGIAKGLNLYFELKQDPLDVHLPVLDSVERTPKNKGQRKEFGDLCPDCGDCALIFEEGCKKCYFCGYSEC